MRKLLHKIFKSKDAVSSDFTKQLSRILGYTPSNGKLYATAFTHRSSKEVFTNNNERLEYLGDAILGAIVADFLCKKYPYKDEGFLTDMRSKMVNRNTLNDIAIKMGFRRITFFNKTDPNIRISQIFGNALEALIGAVYLDKGYKKTQLWVVRKLIIPYLFMDDLENRTINNKNNLYGWASKHGKKLDFDIVLDERQGSRRVFSIAVVVDGETIAVATANTKKEAAEAAALAAKEKLGLQ